MEKFINKPRFAGKFEDKEKFEMDDYKNQPPEVRFFTPIYLHLLNQGVDPKTWRFKKVFHSARKRK